MATSLKSIKHSNNKKQNNTNYTRPIDAFKKGFDAQINKYLTSLLQDIFGTLLLGPIISKISRAIFFHIILISLILLQFTPGNKEKFLINLIHGHDPNEANAPAKSTSPPIITEEISQKLNNIEQLITQYHSTPVSPIVIESQKTPSHLIISSSNDYNKMKYNKNLSQYIKN